MQNLNYGKWDVVSVKYGISGKNQSVPQKVEGVGYDKHFENLKETFIDIVTYKLNPKNVDLDSVVGSRVRELVKKGFFKNDETVRHALDLFYINTINFMQSQSRPTEKDLTNDVEARRTLLYI